jgi:uncharacterized membrane protein
MTKQSFLNQLREALEDQDVSDSVIDETVQEYASMIEDALESGETVEAFIKRMGSPKKVAKALAKDQPLRSSRITALSPFIATILFFIAGVVYQAWHPGWLFFLLIPITGILTTKPVKWRGLFVFVILTIFILVGTSTNLWNPLWSLFLLIIPQSKHPKQPLLNLIATIYTYLAVAAYHILVIYFSFSFMGGYPGVRDLYVALPLLLFIPLVVYALWNGAITIRLDLDWNDASQIKKFLWTLFLILGITVVYLLIGLVWGLWHPGWLLFLLIPLTLIIISSKRIPYVAVMPFIATILFVLVGEYGQIPGQDSAYTLSWLFFLLIPISGILMDKKGALK